MLRLASDADVRGEILRGLRRRLSELDLVRVQDEQSIGSAIDDILLIAEYMPEEEVRDQVVVFLPFRGSRPPLLTRGFPSLLVRPHHHVAR
jgi:hypothetical protein